MKWDRFIGNSVFISHWTRSTLVYLLTQKIKLVFANDLTENQIGAKLVQIAICIACVKPPLVQRLSLQILLSQQSANNKKCQMPECQIQKTDEMTKHQKIQNVTLAQLWPCGLVGVVMKVDEKWRRCPLEFGRCLTRSPTKLWQLGGGFLKTATPKLKELCGSAIHKLL